jgi:hypothetical protein
MATGHNSFSVVAELNSAVPCKIAEPVPPREVYPELPDLSDNPRPYSNYMILFILTVKGRPPPQHVFSFYDIVTSAETCCRENKECI